MNILFVIDTLQTGGAEKSILEITTRFKIYKPVICTLFSKNSDLKESFEKRGIEVIELNLKSRLWLLEGVKKIRAVSKTIKPALIHANLFKAELLVRIAFNKKEQVHIGSFVNDSYAVERYQKQNSIENFKLHCYRLIDALTARRVSHFTSITNTIALTNANALRLNPEKITTIYRGRRVDNFSIHHPEREGKTFVFLTVARLLKRKGYMELIDAASILKECLPDFKIMIAGEGPDKDLFIDKISTLGLNSLFHFLGTRKDVPDLLQQAHCFLFPSHYEGQGGALVEAMLAAKPIIATKIPVIEEQLEDGKAGVLFNLFNSEDLATKMFWVYQNYEAAIKLGLEARRVAEDRFNIDKVAEQHEKLYAQLIENK